MKSELSQFKFPFSALFHGRCLQNANSLFANRVADWAAQPLRYEPDSGLDNRRRLFITWLVDCAVRSYEKSFEAWPMDPSAQSVSSNDSRKSKSLTTGSPSSHENLGRRTSSALDVYSMFTTAATTLARHWGLSRDTVIVQHVVALFEANLDEQAELVSWVPSSITDLGL